MTGLKINEKGNSIQKCSTHFDQEELIISQISHLYSIFRLFIAYFLSFLLIFQPMVGYAGGIVIDGNAPDSRRAVLDAAQNGVPVVNITNPSAGGVSRNSFSDFNVGARGVIINNSLAVGISQLGGALPGNSNFTSGQTARIILSEVNGTGRSNLNGATEIFGDRAEYILANPNGITCNGCGFINTPHVTLSTGTADVAGGILRGFNVSRGDVRFVGQDAGVTNLDSFDIISRTASFAAAVYAGRELNVITGNNYVDYNSKAITAASSTSAAPQVAIDSSALGGMYAGKINLVATESGVGVNTQGSLGSSTSDISITADGHIEFKDANSKNDIKITSTHSGVKHSGNSYSTGKTEITAAQTVELADGFTAAKGDVQINSATLYENNAASLMAGVDAITSGSDATFTDNGIGNLVISASASNAGFMSGSSITANADSFNNTGLVQSAGDITITAGSISNLNNYVFDTSGNIAGGINSSGTLTLISTSGNIDNTGGAVSSTGLLTIIAANSLINNSLISGSSNIVINAASVDNSNNLHTDSNGNLDKGILSGGRLDVNTTAGVINSNGALYSDDELTVTSGGAVTSTGLIASNSDINMTSGSINNSGGIVTGYDILLQATASNVSNTGGQISGNNVGITANNGNFDNTNGLSQSAGTTTINSKGVVNDNSYHFTNGTLDKGIISTGDFTATIGTNGFSNNSGAITSSGQITITTSGNFTNSGLINATQELQITAANINNSNSYALTNGALVKGLISQSTIALSALSGNIVNTNGTISGAGLTLTASGQLVNNSLVQSTGNITINTASVDNSGSYAADFSKGIIATGDIRLQVSGVRDTSINNNNGTIAGNNIDINSNGVFANDAGLVQSSGNANISVTAIDNTNTNIVDANGTLIKGIMSSGLLTLNSTSGDIDNTAGALSSGSNTVITSSGSFTNSGLVQSGDNLNITASSIDNSNSYEVTNGKLSKGLIASGTITLNAGTGDISNAHGGISSSKTFSLSGYNIDNSNGYVSANGVTGTSLIIATNALDNQSGSILSKANLTISGASGDNTSGGVISAKNALNITIANGGELDNTGGDIYSESGSITGQNINNNGGRIQAANQVTITQTNGVFDNTHGTVLAFSNGSTVTINAVQNILNQGGNIISIQNTDLNLGTAYTITGTITTGGHVDITATSITNNAVVTAGDYINLVTTSNDITNNSGGQLISGTLITLSSSGSLYNYGIISGPAITITASNGGVYNYDEITSAGTLDINASNSSVNNYGRISAEGDANINAVTITNSNAQIASNDTLTITTTGNSIHNINGGLLYATNDLTLHATDIENTSSDIFSLDGNITIDKTTGVRNTSITNTSGSIEAFTGDVNIYTDALTNNRTSYASVVTPPMDAQGNVIVNGQIWEGSWDSWLASTGVGAALEQATISTNPYIYRIQGTNGAASSISSGRDININAGSSNNDGGLISANRDITITGGSVINNAHIAQEWAYYIDSWNASDSWWYRIRSSFENPGLFSGYTFANASAASSIVAARNLSGAISNLNNAISGYGTATLGVQSANLSTSSLPGAAQVVAVNNTQLTQNQAITTGGVINGVSAAQTSSAITSASSAAALAVSLIALPTGNNSLFRENTAPSANYLIETNIAFIDQTKFLGSDYFLTRIGYTPPSNQKLLGDAFYTTQLVRQQIFEKTAQRYIEHGISTDLGQMQALMDNAVTEKTALNLSVGIELSATQVASLTSDIIWLVDQVIDGQHALVPVVYLAQATLDGLSGNPANISAGNDLTLTASNNISNTGAISAGHNLSLTAGNDITNTGGLIKAGNNVTLVATNGNIINQATLNKSSDSVGNYIRQSIAAQGNITAGGNASLTAANDVDALASIVTAAGSVDINAGGDVNIASESLRNRTAYSTKKYTKIDDVTTHVSSEITAGTDVNITSGNNTILQASKLEAGNDVHIEADGAVALLAASDSEFHQEKKSQKSIMWQSSSDVGSTKNTVSNVEITAGGNVNITGTDGVAVQYKDTGNLNDSINQLSKAPELAYLKTLQNQAQNNPAANIQFQGVQEAYNSWDYHQSGLTPAGAAIIAIAVTAATMGAGSGVGAGVMATSQAGFAVTGAAATAATNAAFATLAAQASVSLINNKGNINKTLKDLASSETIKNMAFAAVTAGTTVGIANATGLGNIANSNTLNPSGGANLAQRLDYAVIQSGVNSSANAVINGGDLGDGLKTSLLAGIAAAGGAWASGVGSSQMTGYQGNVADIALQGVIGCGAASAGGGSCGAGAMGGAVGGIAGVNGYSADQARLAGAFGSLVTGGGANDLYTAANTAESQAGVVAYTIENVKTRPDLGAQLKDGYDQVGKSNAVQYADHVVADIVPLNSNNGGLITKLATIAGGETATYMDSSGKGYSLDELKANPSLLSNIKSVFINGILNPLDLAINNAKEQTGQDTTTLIHIPTHGTIPDGIEVVWNKLFGDSMPTGNLQQAGQLLDIIKEQNVNVGYAAHSGGGTILAPWVDAQDANSMVGSQIGFSGVPIGGSYLKDIGNNATGQDAVVHNHPGDFVGDIMGGNASSPIRLAEGLGGFFLLPTSLSPHSHYECSVCNNTANNSQ